MTDTPKLSKLELRIMEVLWSRGPSAIRQIQECLSGPAVMPYTTIQTTVYRMEEKGILRRAKKVSHAHVFEALVSRESASGKLIDEFFSLFGNRIQPVMAHLVQTGKVTLADIDAAYAAIREQAERAEKEKRGK